MYFTLFISESRKTRNLKKSISWGKLCRPAHFIMNIHSLSAGGDKAYSYFTVCKLLFTDQYTKWRTPWYLIYVKAVPFK